MTTADKLTRLKTDFDDVYNKGYENGKANPDPELVKQAELFYRSKLITFTDDNTLTEIEMDCTNKTSLDSTFMYCYKLGSVKLRNTNKVKSFRYCFYGTPVLKSIETLDFSAVTKFVGNDFTNVKNVTHFRIVPNTLKCSAPFYNFAVLDDDSIQSVVNGYADMTGQTSPVLTLHADVKARIVADDAKEDTDTTKRYWLRTLTSKNVTLA